MKPSEPLIMLWSSAPAVALFAASLACAAAVAPALRLAAVFALAIGGVAALPVALTWNRGINAALAGMLGAVLIRLFGLVAVALVLPWSGVALVPALCGLGGCVIVGLMIDGVLRSQILSAQKEPARA